MYVFAVFVCRLLLMMMGVLFCSGAGFFIRRCMYPSPLPEDTFNVAFTRHPMTAPGESHMHFLLFYSLSHSFSSHSLLSLFFSYSIPHYHSLSPDLLYFIPPPIKLFPFLLSSPTIPDSAQSFIHSRVQMNFSQLTIIIWSERTSLGSQYSD